MLQELTINQVKAILLSMAENEKTTPIFIQKFLEIFLIKKPILVVSVKYPFFVRCSPNDYSANANSCDAVFKNTSRCSYNPNSNSIGLQRCNYAKQQVFYASAPANSNQVSADMTALLEVSMNCVKNKQISRSYFTLSRWKLNRPLNMAVLPFSRRSRKRDGDFKLMNKEFDRVLKQSTEGDSERYQYFKAFLEFMSNIFCKRIKGNCYYKISSAYFNAMMKITDERKNVFFNFDPPTDYQIDGILYPSANSKAQGMNICLRKEVIDDLSLECDYVAMSAMQRNPNNLKDIVFPKVANEHIPDANGDIHFTHIW